MRRTVSARATTSRGRASILALVWAALVACGGAAEPRGPELPTSARTTCQGDGDCVLTTLAGEDCCTVWCEPSAFTTEEAARIRAVRDERCPRVRCSVAPPSPCPPPRFRRPVARCERGACVVAER